MTVSRLRAWTRALATLAIGCVSCGSVPASTSREPPRGASWSLGDPRWHFEDERGEPVTLAGLAGAPVVLTMFYTACRLRCPMTVAKVRKVEFAFRRANRPVHVVTTRSSADVRRAAGDGG